MPFGHRPNVPDARIRFGYLEPRMGFYPKARGCLPQASYPGDCGAKATINPNGVASA